LPLREEHPKEKVLCWKAHLNLLVLFKSMARCNIGTLVTQLFSGMISGLTV
jgi:hypothetical protein